MINTIICLAGKICSGKSTYSNIVLESFNFPVLSFGKYLVNYSKDNNLPTTRSALQDLGNAMISTNASAFLDNVLNYANVTEGNFIIEGVRHKIILEELKKKTNKVVLIFIEAPIEIRYQRFLKRKKDGDPEINFEKFFAIDSHQVESEIEALKIVSDIIIDSTISIDDFKKNKFIENVSDCISSNIN
jgi:dephospho-CoA kinase